MFLFIVAVGLCIFGLVSHHKWKRSLMSSMGEWVYDAELDMTFWRYDSDIESALKELDKEFPGLGANHD